MAEKGIVMRPEEQSRRAERFLTLHHTKPILVLPNAWDVISAKIYEEEGFPAVATTSAGIAATLGYADGQRISRDEMIAVVARIAQRLSVALSADLEAGYSASPEGVAATCMKAVEAGAAGINLEDGTGDPAAPLLDIAAQCDRIRAVREVLAGAGRRVVVNARTDVYLVAGRPETMMLSETIERGNAYARAGADCVFVPDMEPALDRPSIARLADEIDAPLNLIVSAASPSLAELERLGVARVTFGPRAMRSALALIRDMAREWRASGTTSLMREGISYGDINRMLE